MLLDGWSALSRGTSLESERILHPFWKVVWACILKAGSVWMPSCQSLLLRDFIERVSPPAQGRAPNSWRFLPLSPHPEGRYWAFLTSCIPETSRTCPSGSSPRLDPCLFWPLTDVLASAIPQLQVPERLREGGQPGALLRRDPHHQECA